MRKTMAYTLIALGTVLATPVVAQGVYVGPNGVGADTGFRHHHDYDRDRDYGRRDRDGNYEGRSAYRPRYHDEDRY